MRDANGEESPCAAAYRNSPAISASIIAGCIVASLRIKVNEWQTRFTMPQPAQTHTRRNMNGGREIFVGCSGWFYWHWKGLFYPAEIATHRGSRIIDQCSIPSS
jgi:hypothetical protein